MSGIFAAAAEAANPSKSADFDEVAKATLTHLETLSDGYIAETVFGGLLGRDFARENLQVDRTKARVVLVSAGHGWAVGRVEGVYVRPAGVSDPEANVLLEVILSLWASTAPAPEAANPRLLFHLPYSHEENVKVGLKGLTSLRPSVQAAALAAFWDKFVTQ